LKDDGFELISAAQDTGGEAAAGQWFDRAEVTFTQIVDENHTISSLYNMVNVPTGVWIDEQGMIVRPNETAYSSNTNMELSGKTLSSRGGDYVSALKDWVAKGAESAYALTPEQVTQRWNPRSSEHARADALFQLGNHFIRADDEARANQYWQEAQALRPESWNYHRQDWSFTPAEAGRNWMQKFLGLGDEEYYAPLDLPELSD